MPRHLIPWLALVLGLAMSEAVLTGPAEACEVQPIAPRSTMGCRDMGRFEPPGVCQHLPPVMRCPRAEGAADEAGPRRRAARPSYLPLVIVGTTN